MQRAKRKPNLWRVLRLKRNRKIYLGSKKAKVEDFTTLIADKNAFLQLRRTIAIVDFRPEIAKLVVLAFWNIILSLIMFFFQLFFSNPYVRDNEEASRSVDVM